MRRWRIIRCGSRVMTRLRMPYGYAATASRIFGKSIAWIGAASRGEVPVTPAQYARQRTYWDDRCCARWQQRPFCERRATPLQRARRILQHRRSLGLLENGWLDHLLVLGYRALAQIHDPDYPRAQKTTRRRAASRSLGNKNQLRLVTRGPAASSGSLPRISYFAAIIDFIDRRSGRTTKRWRSAWSINLRNRSPSGTKGLRRSSVN